MSPELASVVAAPGPRPTRASTGPGTRRRKTVRVQNLADGATRKFKGGFDNGTVQMEFLFDSADAGQTLIEAAETSTSTYYWKIGLPSGEEFYFAALVTSVKRVIGGPNDALMLRCTVEIDHRSIVEGT